MFDAPCRLTLLQPEFKRFKSECTHSKIVVADLFPEIGIYLQMVF